MKKRYVLILFSLAMLLVSACSRTLDNGGDPLVDEYEGIKTIPDPDLTALTVTNSGGNAIMLIPSFDRDTTNYQASVNNAVTEIQLIGTTSHTNATIRIGSATLHTDEISAPIALIQGTNRVNIDVLAQDGLTMKRYSLDVIRTAASGSTNNLLASLVTSPSNISGFDPGTTVYNIPVAYEVSSLDVTPTVDDATASLWINGSPVTSGNTRAVSLPSIGTNTITVLVQAENGAQRAYTIRAVRAEAPPSPLASLLITEWADIGAGVDFIEIRNFGSIAVTISNTFGVLYHGKQALITQWFTGTNIAAVATSADGVVINPGEVFLITDSDITPSNLSNYETWGMPGTCKIFLSDKSTLLGTVGGLEDRLDHTIAVLTNNDGLTGWGETPDPAAFGTDVGTSTCSVLSNGFDIAANSTTDTAWWENGGATGSQFRTPGVWP